MTDLFEPETITSTSLDVRRVQREQARKARRTRTAIAVAVGLAFFALGASVSYNFLKAFQSDPDSISDYEGAGQGRVTVVINPGDGGDAIAKTLYDAGVIASEQAFLLETYANPESAAKIQPGHYWLQKEMKAEHALFALLDPGRREVVRITAIEGNMLSHYFEKIATATGTTVEEVEAIAEDTAALGLPEEAKGNLEGWLFPDTYNFNPGVTPQEVLSRMVQETVKVLDEKGVEPKDRVRVLTIASLIEREAALDDDRPLVSSVIHNRLKADMALELDSTVHYFAGHTGSVYTSAEDRKKDNPYNTYKRVGLPPTPIAGASEASIDAALNPASTKFMFFVTINLTTGETAFAETYSEHLRNVDRLRAWERENKD